MIAALMAHADPLVYVPGYGLVAKEEAQRLSLAAPGRGRLLDMAPTTAHAHVPFGSTIELDTSPRPAPCRDVVGRVRLFEGGRWRLPRP